MHRLRVVVDRSLSPRAKAQALLRAGLEFAAHRPGALDDFHAALDTVLLLEAGPATLAVFAAHDPTSVAYRDAGQIRAVVLPPGTKWWRVCDDLPELSL